MLRYFPEAHPEELFLSIVARYGEHLRLWRRQQVQQQLFGRGNIVIGIEMPRALGALVDRLPANSRFSVDDLIDKHTLLNLYLPFIAPDSRNFARRAMCDSEVRDVMALIGRNVKIQAPDWLRFCPVCWKHDQQMFGEPFWHRSHQVPGVEVCVEHFVFLEASKAHRNVPSSRYVLNTAKTFCFDVEPRPVNATNQYHRTLLDIARDVAWLLEKNKFFPDQQLLQRRYIELLHEKGFAASVNKIHHDRLREAIKDRFSDPLLQSLDCSLSENGNCKWIKRLIRQDISVLKHPLQHIVLIRTLGFSIESFFSSLYEMPTKFGRGPWPCNNPVCPEREQRIIECYETYYNSNSRKSRGLFCCPKCKYSYFATGIIDSASSPFTIGRCHNRGDLWCRRLTSLWSNEANTLCQIGRILKISITALVKQAVRQGLSLRRCDYSDKIRMLANAAIAHSAARIELVQEKRTIWLELRRNYPEASFKQLTQLPNSPVEWLRYNDRSWLLENRPTLRRRGRAMGDHYTLEDWARRDQEYSVQVKQAASAIKLKPGRPIRVSISAICRTISIDSSNSWASQDLSTNSDRTNSRVRPLRASQLTKKAVVKNLPLTKLVVQQVLESAVEFARRRLLWAADECRKNLPNFTRYQLVVMAGVRTLSDKNTQSSESIILRALVDQLCHGTSQTEANL